MTRSTLISALTAWAAELAEGPALVEVIQPDRPCVVQIQVPAAARARVTSQRTFTDTWLRHFPHGQHVLFDPAKVNTVGEALTFHLHLPTIHLED